MPNLNDLGNKFADALLDAVLEAIDVANLPRPELVMRVAGTGVPTSDSCDGMLWTRVTTVFPTSGAGDQFVAARADWSVPAWCFVIEVGTMWCHPVITEDGNSPDPAIWQSMAHRDGQYRMAMINGLAYLYPPKIKDCADGQRIEPWAPLGPQGGFSGGLMLSYTISPHLAEDAGE